MCDRTVNMRSYYRSVEILSYPHNEYRSTVYCGLSLVVTNSKGTGKQGHIVAHDVSHVAQTGKHLLRTQNVSDQNQKHFLCPGHKICVRSKCCARGQTGKHLCQQQCVRKKVSSFASTLRKETRDETDFSQILNRPYIHKM